MATLKIVCILVLEAILVAAVVKKWCSRTVGKGAQQDKEKEPLVADWRTDLKIIDGRVYIDLRGLISNLINTCDVVEKHQSGHES